MRHRKPKGKFFCAVIVSLPRLSPGRSAGACLLNNWWGLFRIIGIADSIAIDENDEPPLDYDEMFIGRSLTRERLADLGAIALCQEHPAVSTRTLVQVARLKALEPAGARSAER